jgi:hypothetical protein
MADPPDAEAQGVEAPDYAPATRARVPAAVALSLYALAALGIALWAAPRTSLNPRALLIDSVEGSAYRPYVYRQLVPLMVRALDAITPAPVRRAVESTFAAHPLLMRKLHWVPSHAYWFVLVFLLHWLSLILFGACMRELVDQTWTPRAPVSIAAGVAAIVFTGLHFGYQNFIYDFPQLALFALGLALLGRDRLRAFYVLYPIGMLNKETFVLMTVIFVFTRWKRLPFGLLMRHVLAQLAIAITIVAALHYIYQNEPGGALEFHLSRNLDYHPSARQLFHDVVYGGFWVLALLSARRRPFLGGLALVIGGLLGGATLFFGYIGEYRDFYEVYPILFLLAFGTVWSAVVGRRRAPPPTVTT